MLSWSGRLLFGSYLTQWWRRPVKQRTDRLPRRRDQKNRPPQISVRLSPVSRFEEVGFS